jgi:hypothetical protein
LRDIPVARSLAESLTAGPDERTRGEALEKLVRTLLALRLSFADGSDMGEVLQGVDLPSTLTTVRYARANASEEHTWPGLIEPIQVASKATSEKTRLALGQLVAQQMHAGRGPHSVVQPQRLSNSADLFAQVKLRPSTISLVRVGPAAPAAEAEAKPKRSQCKRAGGMTTTSCAGSRGCPS